MTNFLLFVIVIQFGLIMIDIGHIANANIKTSDNIKKLTEVIKTRDIHEP